MKRRAVHFDEDGYARVMVNPSPELLSLPNLLIEPDLSAVHNIPIEYWKLSNGQIVPMTDDDRLIRDADLSTELDPTWTSVVHKHIIKMPYVALMLLIFEALLLCFLTLKQLLE